METINDPEKELNSQPDGNYKKYLPAIVLAAFLLVAAVFVYFFSEESNRLALYKDAETAISFQYPKNLFILDRDHDGDKMLPNIFFQEYQYPEGDSPNYCPVDCINFSAFFRSENGTPSRDIPLQVDTDTEFPIYDYPRYVYQDDGGSKPFKINDMEAVRYYAAGPADSYLAAYVKDKTAPVKYTIEDRVFIEDPYLKGRVIYIVYQEDRDTLPAPAESLDAAIIKGLFNREKYKEFQNIIASVEVLPIDALQSKVQTSQELGVSFHVPEYWGNLIEPTGEIWDSNPRVETIGLSFESPLFSWNNPSSLEFEADNSQTAAYVWEGSPPLYQYFGQPLDSACQKNAYLDGSGSYDIKMTECSLRTLSNGVRVVVFKGSFANKYAYDEGEIPADRLRFIPFKGAILETKSSKWPGMTIHFEGQGENFVSVEGIFDKVIDSLSYTK